MCGIIGGFNFNKKAKDINEDILNQLEDQIERGEEGFGSVFINKDKSYIIKRATEKVKAIIDLNLNLAPSILCHHRHPTSSDNKIRQTHPFLISHDTLKYNYLIIHNGVINNENKLKKEHEDLGHVYNTDDKTQFNDSEAFAIDLALYIENEQPEIKASGGAAFIALQIDKTTEKIMAIHFGRDGNPLKMAHNRGSIFISSTGKGSSIKEKLIYSYDIESTKTTKRPFKMAAFSYTPIKKDTENKLIPTKTNSTDDDGRYSQSSGYWDKTKQEYVTNEEAEKAIEEIIEEKELSEDEIIELYDAMYDEQTAFINTSIDETIDFIKESINKENLENVTMNHFIKENIKEIYQSFKDIIEIKKKELEEEIIEPEPVEDLEDILDEMDKKRPKKAPFI